MKNILSILALSILGFVNAQVIIGDQAGTASNKTSVLLEFANTGDRGIILPYATSLPSGSGLVGGTILLDASGATQAAVRYYDGTSWVDLSNGNKGDVNTELAIQPTTTETTTKGAIIGAQTSAAEGVLILESATKAMVLPQVASTDDIINPAPGMMVYVNGTNKRLAVFNGDKWSYWAPSN